MLSDRLVVILQAILLVSLLLVAGGLTFSGSVDAPDGDDFQLISDLVMLTVAVLIPTQSNSIQFHINSIKLAPMTQYLESHIGEKLCDAASQGMVSSVKENFAMAALVQAAICI